MLPKFTREKRKLIVSWIRFAYRLQSKTPPKKIPEHVVRNFYAYHFFAIEDEIIQRRQAVKEASLALEGLV